MTAEGSNSVSGVELSCGLFKSNYVFIMTGYILHLPMYIHPITIRYRPVEILEYHALHANIEIKNV